jgi:hypothetical protein
MQHHACTACTHGIDLDLRRGYRHHYGGLATQRLRRQRHALRMIAGRGRNHAAIARRLGRRTILL